MLSLSALIAAVIAVVAAGVRATREVRARLTERTRARRLAQGTTAIADREVVTVEGTVCAPGMEASKSDPAAEWQFLHCLSSA